MRGRPRELAGLPAETAAQIMRTAAETGQTVTARIIRETRVQITQPKEQMASAVLAPAQVDVSGVDGRYTDPEALRESAATLLRLAQRLQDATPARGRVVGP